VHTCRRLWFARSKNSSYLCRTIQVLGAHRYVRCITFKVGRYFLPGTWHRYISPSLEEQYFRWRQCNVPTTPRTAEGSVSFPYHSSKVTAVNMISAWVSCFGLQTDSCDSKTRGAVDRRQTWTITEQPPIVIVFLASLNTHENFHYLCFNCNLPARDHFVGPMYSHLYLCCKLR